MEENALLDHLRLIDLMRKFDQTLVLISGSALGDRPPLMARLRSIRQQITAMEVARR